MALFHLIVQIVAAIVLIKRNDDDFFLAWVTEHGKVVGLDLDPLLASIDLLFLDGELLKILLTGFEAFRVVLEVALGVATLPVRAPGFDRLVEFIAFLVPVIKRQPLNGVADNDWCQADLQVLGDDIEILIGQYDTAV